MANGQLQGVLRHLRKLVAAENGGVQPDRELLDRFVNERDEAAFAGLVHRHGDMVLAVCRRVLHNAHDAEDACQAAFLVLARKAGSIRKKDSLASWLHGVAYRAASNLKRGIIRREAREASVAVSAQSDGADVSWREVKGMLDDELCRLPEGYQAPLVLCYLEGKTRDEAARALGWSAGMVKARLERGRDMLRCRLMRRGLTLSAVLLPGLLVEQAGAAALPALQVVAIVKAGLLIAAGQMPSAGLVSARTVAAMEGVLHAMLTMKLKLVTAGFMMASLIGLGFFLTGGGGPLSADQPAGDEDPPAAASGLREAGGPAGGATAAKKQIDPALMASRKAQSINNLKQLALAMHNYADVHQHFPPPAIYGGKIMGAGLPGMPGGMRPGGRPGMQPGGRPGRPMPPGGFPPGGGGFPGGTPAPGGFQPGGLPPGTKPGTAPSGSAPQGGPPGGNGVPGGGSVPSGDSQTPAAGGSAGGDALPPGLAPQKPGAIPGGFPGGPPGSGLPGGGGGAGFPGGGGGAPGGPIMPPAMPGARTGGKALLSWRVAILPYLDQNELYKQFHLNEPWDSPHNIKLLPKMPKVFAAPGIKTKAPYSTYYQVFVGKGTVFEKYRGIRLPDIFDGTSNTILIVEAGCAVPWTKPADLHYAADEPLPELGGIFDDVIHAAFADGAVHTLLRNCDQDTLRKAIVRDDGYPVDWAKLQRPVHRTVSGLQSEKQQLTEELRAERQRLEGLRREMAELKALADEPGTAALRRENERLQHLLDETRREAQRLRDQIERLRRSLPK
jgi:RNA polymerase sigma factor (sigma-70 family)